MQGREQYFCFTAQLNFFLSMSSNCFDSTRYQPETCAPNSSSPFITFLLSTNSRFERSSPRVFSILFTYASLIAFVRKSGRFGASENDEPVIQLASHPG
jgi:hypothetical protein